MCNILHQSRITSISNLIIPLNTESFKIAFQIGRSISYILLDGQFFIFGLDIFTFKKCSICCVIRQIYCYKKSRSQLTATRSVVKLRDRVRNFEIEINVSSNCQQNHLSSLTSEQCDLQFGQNCFDLLINYFKFTCKVKPKKCRFVISPQYAGRIILKGLIHSSFTSAFS